MNLFKFPIPNFNDKSKSTIFWRHMRFYSRKFLYYPQVKFLEKTLNMKGNEHLKNFFSNRPDACYNAIRRFCDKSFKANERVKTLIYDVDKGLTCFKFLPEEQMIFSFDEDFELFLGYNHNVYEEGFWAFSLKFKKYTISQCNFCFTLENNLLLSCIQGYKYKDFNILEINKILTKKCLGESLSRSIIIYIMNFLTSEKILKKFQAASVQCIKNALSYLKKSNKL